jgi:hypothetical protein
MENLEKSTQNLERYNIILNYFKESENTDRIYENKEYIKNIRKECLEEAYAMLHDSDMDFEIKSQNIKGFNKASTGLKEILELGLIYHLNDIAIAHKKKRMKSLSKDYKIKSGTGPGTGVIF